MRETPNKKQSIMVEFNIFLVIVSMACGIYMGRHWDYFTSEE